MCVQQNPPCARCRSTRAFGRRSSYPLHTILSSYCSIPGGTNAHGSTQNTHTRSPLDSTGHQRLTIANVAVACAISYIFSSKQKLPLLLHLPRILLSIQLCCKQTAVCDCRASKSTSSKAKALPLNVFNTCTKCREACLEHPRLRCALWPLAAGP